MCGWPLIAAVPRLPLLVLLVSTHVHIGILNTPTVSSSPPNNNYKQGAAACMAQTHVDRLAGGHQLAVDVDLAKLVLDDRDALAVLAREDVVEQRGLAAAQEACDHLQEKRRESVLSGEVCSEPCPCKEDQA